MLEGFPEYGVTVNPEKTLVNFNAVMNGKLLKSIVTTDCSSINRGKIGIILMAISY
jgi:hypothetical protein